MPVFNNFAVEKVPVIHKISNHMFRRMRKPDPPPLSSTKSIPGRRHKALDFWYIAPHDRDSLSRTIMPYMAGHIPRRYLLKSLLEKHDWACEIFGLPATQMEDAILDRLQNTTAAFWTDPRRTIVTLVKLARAWFFTLLRYTYRTRFFYGSKNHQSFPDIQDITALETYQYTSELTEYQVYCLTSIPNKYGASFYRKSYKIIQQCSAWIGFCIRIRTFCESLGLFACPEDPEQSLQDLQNNLSFVMAQQEQYKTTTQLQKIAFLAHETARYVDEVDKRVFSEVSNHHDLMEKMRQQVVDLLLQCDKLSSAQELSKKSQQRNWELSVGLQTQCEAWEKELQCLDSKIEGSDARFQREIAMLAEQIKGSGMILAQSNVSKSAHPNVELLVACRWLLEHLPAGGSLQHGFGLRWKLFWQNQWKAYWKGARGDGHPLRGLFGDEKYNKVGKRLYGTLSNFLHGYGRLRVDPLESDVQKVVETISPVHYKNDGQIDLESERRRWSE